MSDRGKLTLAQVGRYQTILAALNGQLTNAQAAQAMGRSVRQIRRLKGKVRAQGPRGVLHGNTGREPENKTPAKERERAIALAVTEYALFNFSHLSDVLAEKHQIIRSDETLRRWLRPLGHGKPIRRGKPHRRRRVRKAQEGEWLYLDGSPHPWFGPDHPRVCLLLCSDDATGKPLYGKFQKEEDREGCFEVCYHVFSRFGLPVAFYLDRASQFKTTRHSGVHVRQSERELTHIQRAMQELNVQLIFAHSPQARGRGERLNGTFQDRLLAELLHRRISDCERATQYLNSTFIPRFWKWFSKPPVNPMPAWRPLPKEMDLKQVLCVKETRCLENDNTVSFLGMRYQLFPPRHLWKVQVQLRFDGSIRFWHPRCGFLKARRLSYSKPKTHNREDVFPMG